MNPFTRAPAAGPILLKTLALAETFSEKIRAALSRREPAIRDYFDLFYAIRKNIIRLDHKPLQKLVKKKLAIPGNQPLPLNDARKKELQRQLQSELEPVLQASVFASFDLQETLTAIADYLGGLEV